MNNESTTLERPAATETTADAQHHARLIDLAKNVFQKEAKAVSALSESLDRHFPDACDLIIACQGRVVVCGVGKSGHIAGKIAATFASTGTAAFFVHPGEATHGDLGMIQPDDVVIAISHGGESAEFNTILPLLQRMGTSIIAITGQPDSTLAQAATAVLNVSVEAEACPLGLAPTSSTTATLAMGDALAVAVLETRGFSAADFAMTHPGGKLGRKLLLSVADIMVRDHNIPVVASQTPLKNALYTMSAGQLGFLAIVDSEQKLLGVFSDGDLRRALDRDIDINSTTIDHLMTPGGHTVNHEQLATEALEIMEHHKIYALPVINHNGMVCGALNMHTLLQAGVV